MGSPTGSDMGLFIFLI